MVPPPFFTTHPPSAIENPPQLAASGTCAAHSPVPAGSSAPATWWSCDETLEERWIRSAVFTQKKTVKLVDLMWLWIKDFVNSLIHHLKSTSYDEYQWYVSMTKLVMWCSHTGLIPIKSWEVQQNYPVRRIRIWAIKFRIYSHDIAVKGCKRM